MTGSYSPDKPGRYDFTAIEAKWQRYWEEQQTFRARNPNEPGAEREKPKFYILDMFPYPSGAGLHVGHPLGYCATDIISRYKRMRGFNVLHPMGFDAVGLPAEQYALETNIHPATTTQKNIEMYRRQLRMFGFSYDWSREFSTTDPKYYRHTQWMFARMFESWYDAEGSWTDGAGRESRGRARPIRELLAELESGRWGVDASLNIVRAKSSPGRRDWHALSPQEQRKALDQHRLAFLGEVPVNWCPGLGTVLANEEVDNDGRSERGGFKVYRRPLKQWMLRITFYAERLLSDLDELDWPEPIKLMQRNWIGKSEGAEVVFPLNRHEGTLARSHEVEGTKGQRDGGTGRVAQGFNPGGLEFDSPTSGAPGMGHPSRLVNERIRVYTTRPDTLYGATYIVLAPEHPLVETITTADHREAIRRYVERAMRLTEVDRTAESKEKTGEFTGSFAFNPVTGESIPIWVADYVLMGYGTGAIMAVPGSDERDFAFACKFNLPIVAVVRPTESWIERRLSEMTESMDAAAEAGFDEVVANFPELRTEIDVRRERADGLANRTLHVLREKVGLSALCDHYVRHPQAWRAPYCEEGVAVNSPRQSRDRKGAVPTSGTKARRHEDTKELFDNSCNLNGLRTPEAKEKITQWLELTGLGRRTVNFKLRDWLFSRQRYWGEPFPVLHGEDGETILVPDDELPVQLPPMADFKPTPVADEDHSVPEPPLARAKEWVNVIRGGKRYRRDLNTMPNWAGSCWYYLRFADPHNDGQFCDPAAEKAWLPVDLYVGGAEHAVLHLLYARFWHKVLFDLGYLSTPEPFRKLFNQGKIQGFAFRDRRGMVVGPDAAEERGENDFVLKSSGEPVTRVIAKMSKSLKNVVNPDEIIAEVGADTFRLYEMYMGPLESDKPWNTRDVPGLFKLVQRIWRLVIDEETDAVSSKLRDVEPDDSALRALHKLIRRVTEDIEQIKLNTAIAAIFDFVNDMTPREIRPRRLIEKLVLVVAPFVPHLAEELWQRLGHTKSLAHEPWPEFEPKFARDETVEIAVQISGKPKAKVIVPADADEAALEAAARSDAKVTEALAGKSVRKVIVVKGRLVNFVAN